MTQIISSTITFLFKSIFPDFESFKNFVTIEVDARPDEQYIKFVYRVLFREYANSNVQYDTKEEFKLDFANALESIYWQYKRQRELLDKAYKVTDDQLIALNQVTLNQANGPNKEVDDPTQPLKFIGAQTWSKTRGNELEGYLRAIENITDLKVASFLARFRPLFKTYLTPQYYTFSNKEEY